MYTTIISTNTYTIVVLTSVNKVQYSLEEAYMNFIKCYQTMNKLDEGNTIIIIIIINNNNINIIYHYYYYNCIGYLYIAKEYVARNDYGYNPLTYINRTLEINPNNVGAHVLTLQILQQDSSDEGNVITITSATNTNTNTTLRTR